MIIPNVELQICLKGLSYDGEQKADNKTAIAFVRRYLETLDAEKRPTFRVDFIQRTGLNEKETVAFLGPEAPND